MPQLCEAYLDIETTGLSSIQNDITVIGIFITEETDQRLIQLVGRKISKAAILDSLDGVSSIYTYNGHRFDLPFINNRYDVDLESKFTHCDLMHHCWGNKLFGGLKVVEQCLGIERKTKDVNGYEAIRLWWKYVEYADPVALAKLLEYNKEDVINLKVLREKLFNLSK
jgi:uncharacterized protein YprB with RNaseH-like and TPR domain